MNWEEALGSLSTTWKVSQPPKVKHQDFYSIVKYNALWHLCSSFRMGIFFPSIFHSLGYIILKYLILAKKQDIKYDMHLTHSENLFGYLSPSWSIFLYWDNWFVKKGGPPRVSFILIRNFLAMPHFANLKPHFLYRTFQTHHFRFKGKLPSSHYITY